MPVPLDTHNPDLNLTPGTTKSDIIAFLYSHSDLGYKPSEIAEELDIPRGTATGTLKRLYEADYVAKTEDGYYHALEDRADLRRYVSSLNQLHRMFDRQGQTPEQDTARDEVDDEALEAELEELEADLDQ